MPSIKEKKAPIPETVEGLEKAAYFHWQARGCPVGDPMTDWLEAEKELNDQGTMKKSRKKQVPGRSLAGAQAR